MNCPPTNFRECPYYNPLLDPEYHCYKDSNIGICILEQQESKNSEVIE